MNLKITVPDPRPRPEIEINFTAHYGVAYNDYSGFVAAFFDLDDARAFLLGFDYKRRGLKKPRLIGLNTSAEYSWPEGNKSN